MKIYFSILWEHFRSTSSNYLLYFDDKFYKSKLILQNKNKTNSRIEKTVFDANFSFLKNIIYGIFRIKFQQKKI
jgi:hypothetical protein